MRKIILYMLFLLVSCGTVRNTNVGNDATGNSRNDATAEMTDTASLVAVPAPGQLWGKTYGDYVFHDDYYWFYSFSKKEHSKEHLIRYPDRYAIFYDSNYKAEVEGCLETLGFKYIKKARPPYRFHSEKSVLCDVAVIEGKGDLRSIPYVIYTCPMYMVDDGRMFGADPTFHVRFDGSDEQKLELLKYARQHRIYPIGPQGTGSTSRKYFIYECTNGSSGNAVEMGNWFVERTEFNISHAEFGDAPVDFD